MGNSHTTTDITSVLETKVIKPTIGISTEAELQAIMYSKLSTAGFNIRLQYKVDDCIFDAVVFNAEHRPMAIIEVKRLTHRQFNYKTPQIEKYRKYDLPVFGLNHPEDIHILMSELDSLGARKFTVDVLYEMLPDLVNDTFRPWYCKMFYGIGRERVLDLAALARADGKNPRRYFSMLLKRERPRIA